MEAVSVIVNGALIRLFPQTGVPLTSRSRVCGSSRTSAPFTVTDTASMRSYPPRSYARRVRSAHKEEPTQSARSGRSRFQALCAWMRPQSGMHRTDCARACACLRGHIPGGAPVLRCGTRPELPGPQRSRNIIGLCQGAAPALLRSLLGLKPHLRSASAQAEQVPPALAGGCDPETLALHAEQMRSLGRLRGHIPGGAPVPRSGVPSSHPHLAQRASWDLCRASLV